MKTRIILILLVLFFLEGGYFWEVPSKSKAQYTPSKSEIIHHQNEEKIIKEMDNTLQEAHFNGSALVVKDGEVLLDKGYGYADFKQKVENSPNTAFWIGSITKSSIAVAILQLQEKGKLNIHDNVNKYIPFFPAAKNIQLYHLLTHTSGLPDRGARGAVVASPASYVNWISKQKLSSVPGTTWKYSDYNYVVLAYVVESVTKEPLDKYIKTHIFQPAGMTESGFGKAYFQGEHQSKGYRMQNGTLIDVSGLNLPSLFGCGDIYMTTHDMYKFDRAVMDGTLLSKESLRQMMTPASKSTYGFGFYISPEQNIHNHGVVTGWNTFNTFNWKKQGFVILFSNVYGLNMNNINSRFMELTTSANL